MWNKGWGQPVTRVYSSTMTQWSRFLCYRLNLQEVCSVNPRVSFEMAATTPKDMEKHKEGEYINPKCIRNGAGNEKKTNKNSPVMQTTSTERCVSQRDSSDWL